MNPIQISRRKLAFWVGFGLFSVANKTGLSALDDLAAATMRTTEPDGAASKSQTPNLIGKRIEHWIAVRNSKWRWYERESFAEGVWTTTGITTPIHRGSGESLADRHGYIAIDAVPFEVLDPKDRTARPDDPKANQDQRKHYRSLKPIADQNSADEFRAQDPESLSIEFGDLSQEDAGRSNDGRRRRHGRPPSKWLRSLTADEIRTWLSKVEIQVAFVEGMTYSTHLTRDHKFLAENIEGLTESELSELHGAAHEGF